MNVHEILAGRRALHAARFEYDESKHPRDGQGRWAQAEGYLKTLPESKDWGSGVRVNPLPYAKLSDAQRADIKRQVGGGRAPNDWRVVDLPIASLKSRQRVVQDEKVRDLINSKAPDSLERHPLVYRTTSGQHVVLDGNHRTILSIAEGRTHVRARIVEERP